MPFTVVGPFAVTVLPVILAALPVLPTDVAPDANPVLMFVAPLMLAPLFTVAPPLSDVAPVTPSVPPTVAPPVTVADASVEAPACNVPLTVVAPAVNAAVFVA